MQCSFRLCPFSDEGQSLHQIKVIEYRNKDTTRNRIVKMAQLHDKLTDINGLVNRRFSIQVKNYKNV